MERVQGLGLHSTRPLDADGPRSWLGLASALRVLPSGVWPRRRFRTVGRGFAQRRGGLHAWKTGRTIRLPHHADQLSTPPEPLVWNIPASMGSSPVEILGVERDDGDPDLPSDPVGHRAAEHVPPSWPATSSQQNEIRVLCRCDPDDFINRAAYGHHRVDVGPTPWWNQGVELPARLLTDIAADEGRLEPRPDVCSAQIDHVAEEEWEPADGITAVRLALDHMEEEGNPSHCRSQVNARPDRRQRRFGEIRGYQNAIHHLSSPVLLASRSDASRDHEPCRPIPHACSCRRAYLHRPDEECLHEPLSPPDMRPAAFLVRMSLLAAGAPSSSTDQSYINW
jgi:hypothetical protein